MDFENIKLDKDDENKIATLTLNRPDKANAVNPEMLEEIDEATDQLWDDEDVNVILVTGADGNFSAGFDLNSGPLTEEDARKGQRVWKKFTEIPKIVVAAIEGNCLGGGLELASSCDLRVAKEGATLGFPEAGLGILPGWGGTQRVPKLIGISRAMELCLTAERISAEKAEKFGLVNKFYSEDEFEEKADEYANQLAENVDPDAAKVIKRVVNRGGEVPNDVGLELENLGLGSLL